MTMNQTEIVTPEELARRVIEPHQFVADTEAFVDVRIERSKGKASYSFIGPGVSQNADQAINLTVPHGFNLGAASMPHGVINNPHLHYTAEVFICTRGSFRITVGRHSDQSLDIGIGDVFSAPPWIFRGFENTGPDDSWVFVALGGDDTGGIIWSPDVLREAADTGLYLAADNSIIDTTAGESAENVATPATDAELEAVDIYTDAQLETYVVRADARDWSDRALLSSVLEGHRSSLAPVLGFGLSEDRRHRTPIATAQGFSIEWLRIGPGQQTGTHRIGEAQALLLTEGDWQIELNQAKNVVTSSPAQGSVVSVPPHAWRNFRNTGAGDAIACIICGTDSPNRIEWHPQVIRGASELGWVRDAAAKIAPVGLLSQPES